MSNLYHKLNVIEDPDRVSAARIVLRQVKGNYIIYLLLIAAVISFFIGEALTAFTVIGVILMVIVVSFVQEYRAEKAIASLKEMITPVTTVIRDGKEQEVQTINLVPDDIVVLRTGEKIPADCVVLKASSLRVNESILTGESKEVAKDIDSPLFAGTFLVNGKCQARVVKIGMDTKFGQITKMVSRAEKNLPLMEKVNRIAKYMVIAAVGISFLTGLLMLPTNSITSALIVAIALMVSAFPEGLPVVLLTSLAVGASRMAKNNAIVNRMSIIETLGETTVICVDKTGTITTGEMTVKKITINGKITEIPGAGYEANGEFPVDKKLHQLLTACVICNDSRIERTGEDNFYRVIGSPTEGALLIAAAKAKIFRDDLEFKIIDEIPFSSERKMMSVICLMDGREYKFVKGAPEVVLGKKSKETNRTLAVAIYQKNKLELSGLVVLDDPPRAEVKGALETCREAGIGIKMITGDSQETAEAVASQIGLTGKTLTGDELDKITDEELAGTIKDVGIFCRVRPEHKLRIVKILKSLGEVVTMTGDGVNDAPALKEAQIGVAMGKGGTDVSRSVADLTLKDDNFATIVMAVKEGRTIFNNMRKFVSYQLSCNWAELMILFLGVLLGPFLGWQTPILLALQILFMNLVTDDLPAITFAFNASSRDVMQEGPRRNPEILNVRLVGVVILAGAMMMGLTLLSYGLAYNLAGQSAAIAQSTALITLILLEIINAFNFRSFRFGTLGRSLFTNKYLFIASAVSLIISVLIFYTPARVVFGTVPLGLNNWLIALAFTCVFVLIFDGLKVINNRQRFLEFT